MHASEAERRPKATGRPDWSIVSEAPALLDRAGSQKTGCKVYMVDVICCQTDFFDPYSADPAVGQPHCCGEILGTEEARPVGYIQLFLHVKS